MAHQQASTSDQVQKFLNDNGGCAVVDLFATWCGPCKAIAPYVEQKNQSTGVPLLKVDVDEAADLAGAYKVTAMPTFLVIQGNWDNVVERIVGGGQANVDKAYNKATSIKG